MINLKLYYNYLLSMIKNISVIKSKEIELIISDLINSNPINNNTIYNFDENEELKNLYIIFLHNLMRFLKILNTT